MSCGHKDGGIYMSLNKCTTILLRTACQSRSNMQIVDHISFIAFLFYVPWPLVPLTNMETFHNTGGGVDYWLGRTGWPWALGAKEAKRKEKERETLDSIRKSCNVWFEICVQNAIKNIWNLWRAAWKEYSNMQIVQTFSHHQQKDEQLLPLTSWFRNRIFWKHKSAFAVSFINFSQDEEWHH